MSYKGYQSLLSSGRILSCGGKQLRGGKRRSRILASLLNTDSVISSDQRRSFSVTSQKCATEQDVSDPPAVEAPKPKADEFYDIIITGGGLVGTTLAVALGNSGRLADKRILLLESVDKFWTKPPETVEEGKDPNFSNRVVALSPGSKALFSKLGIWQDVWRHQTVSCLQVWDALSDANITFNYPDFSTPVSFIVENPVLAHAICENLEKVENVTVKFGSRMQSCSIPSARNPGERASVTLESGEILDTDLVIGADGFNSKVRNSISTPAVAFNYDRSAVVATLKLAEAENNHIAWQRFLTTGGPIALLPLAPNFSSLVWSARTKYAKELLEMEPQDFVDAINSALWKEHKRSELVKISSDLLRAFNLQSKQPRLFPPAVTGILEKSRASFPLGFGHAAYYASRRAVLIGDAAHRVHPLAGQGLNLGLGDVEVLEQILSEAVGFGGDIGSFDVLREYESRRQRHNVAIQSGVDFLHRLYSFEASPVVALRSVGLSLVNSSNFVKNIIMNRAAV